MKKFVLPLAVFVSLASTNAMAATTDLTVTGTITPAACIPTLANAGVVDYGSLAVTELQETPSNYILPKKSINISIQCSTPATFALIASDNRNDHANTLGSFGLGKHQDQTIGTYFIRLNSENLLIDGVQGTFLESLDAGNSWKILSDIWFEESGDWPEFRMGFSSGVEPRPTAASSVTAIMDIYGQVKKDLPFSDRVELDGSATVELLYL